VNGFNSPIKRHILANWVKKVLFVVCKKHTSLTKTYQDWKLKDEKCYSK
jgi:hypothetical protein